jgi:hypothetical protein
VREPVSEIMAGIRIHDRTDDDVLAFDLSDLLEALGKEAELSAWKCSVGECIPKDGGRPDLEDAYNAATRLSGAEILALAGETLQIVDGAFEAYRRGERQPWIVLEAIDSTYWEVFAATADDLSPLRRRFSEVEDIEEDGE